MVTNKYPPMIVCEECGSQLGGQYGKDPYSHLLGCLIVEPNALHRIRANAIASGNKNGERILHIVDALLAAQEGQAVSG